MRPVLASAALALMVATPAAAADFVAQAGVNANVFANTDCTRSTANVTGNAPVSAENVCSRADIGTGHARSFANFGHLGVEADVETHSDSLGAGASGQADFTDFVTFTQTNGTGAATTDVSVDMLLDGVLNAGAELGGGAGARVEGFVILYGSFFNFVFERFSDGSSNATGSLVRNGDLINERFVQLGSGIVTVPVATPVRFRLHLEDGVGAGGPASSALADFGSASFKLSSQGPAFHLADGFTANAGDWLVDNRFIDPLAAGVPEPAAWALMILGFGLAGASLRRHRAVLSPA